jgi:hypothetical protein
MKIARTTGVLSEIRSGQGRGALTVKVKVVPVLK